MSESISPVPKPDSVPSRADWRAQVSAWVLVGATAAVFWPVTRWIVAETVARQQIRQAFILLAAAVAVVIWKQWPRLRVTGEAGGRALTLVAAAFALAGAAGLTGWPVLVLPAFALAVAGCVQALFGAESFRYFRPLVAGVGALLVIIVAFPTLDWPLRQLAAAGSAQVLDALGLAPQLTLAGTRADPQLVLSVAEGHFLVATECNGFGLITSGALVAILAGGIAGRPWWAVALLVPAALVIGFVVNVLRILIISTTARYFPGHYDALHEIVGTLALWGGLGLVGWLAWRSPRAAAQGAPGR
jgi:exosortase/archaeosortase family protein